MASRDDWLRVMMTPGSSGLPGAILRGSGWAASQVYSGALATRNRMYDVGVLPTRELRRPVVSVGNLSTGGTGKTPMVAYIARWLQENGRRPAVLLRGYGAVGGVSDEQQELAELLPGVSVLADPDRVAAAGRALLADPGIGSFVLDDAFQHRRVRRDLNVVLVSATQGLSGGHVLPRGLLRERPAGLRRADVIVLTRVNQVSGEELEAVRATVGRYAPAAPVLACVHAPRAVELVHHPDGGASGARAEGRLQPALALAATGDPAAFHRTLVDMGMTPAEVRTFPDHHPYTANDLASVMRQGQAAGVEAIVTTGKDWAKLSRMTGALMLPVYVVRIEVEFLGGDEAALQRLLRERVLRDRLGEKAETTHS